MSRGPLRRSRAKDRSPSPPPRSSPAPTGGSASTGATASSGSGSGRRSTAGSSAEFTRSVPGYEAERAVRLTFPVDDFTAVLEGRLDGRFEEEGRVVVDEVKSLHFAEDLAKLPGSPRLARFETQLRWYLLAVSRAEGRDVAGRLVLADIETRCHAAPRRRVRPGRASSRT